MLTLGLTRRGSPRHDPSGADRTHAARAAHAALLWPEAARGEPRAGGHPNSNRNPTPALALALRVTLTLTLRPNPESSP